MTSTTSCYKLSRDVRAQFLSMRGIILLMTCYYMLIGPVFAYLSTTVVLRGDTATLAFRAGQAFLQNNYFIFYPTAIIFGAVGATYITRYQHVQKQSNYYHSLPISRVQLLTSRIVAMVSIQVVLVALSIILMVLISGRIPIDDFMLRVAKWAAVHFFHLLLTFLLSFSVGLLAGQLTANTISQLLMIGVLHLAVPMTGLTLLAVLDEVFSTFMAKGLPLALSGWNIFKSMKFTAAREYGVVQEAGLTAFKSSDLIWSVSQYLTFIALTVVAFVLTYMLYKRRRTEKAGETLQYRAVGTFLKVFYMVLGTSIVGFIFYSIGDAKNPLGFVLGTVLAMVIIHTVVEMIYQQDLHGMRRHWISAILGLTITLGIYGICVGGVIDYDHYVPDASKIKAATIQFQFEEGGGGIGWDIDDEALHNPEYVATVLDTARKLSEKHLTNEEQTKRLEEYEDQYGLRLDDETATQWVQVTYQDRWGIDTVRQYQVSNKDFREIYGDIVNQPNYHEKLWKNLLEKPVEEYSSISIDGDIVLGQGNDMKSLVYQDAKGRTVNPEPKRTEALINAMKQDIKKRNAETFKSGQVSTLYLDDDMGTRSFNVYKNDIALNQLLEKWRAEGYLTSKEALAQMAMANNDFILVKLDKSEKSYTEIRKVSDVEEVTRLINEETVSDMTAVIFGTKVKPDEGLMIRAKLSDVDNYGTLRYLIEK